MLIGKGVEVDSSTITKIDQPQDLPKSLKDDDMTVVRWETKL